MSWAWTQRSSNRGGSSNPPPRPPSPPPPTLGPEHWHATHPRFPIRARKEYPKKIREGPWPKCECFDECVVQLYDGQPNAARRFFRCPNGSSSSDEECCRYSEWVDPEHSPHVTAYIEYLQERICELELEKDEQLLSQFSQSSIRSQQISGHDETLICYDPYCQCPHHKPPPSNAPPGSSAPPPPAPIYGDSQEYNYDEWGSQIHLSGYD